MTMRIAVASDHRGIPVRQKIVAQIQEMAHDVVDLGSDGSESVDYPDFAEQAARGVADGLFDRAILICGTGIGMCIVANKFPGVRAACCHDDLTAEMCRRHNDANVLCLSADLTGDRLALRMVEIWLTTEFEGGRHSRRIEKISQIEQRMAHGGERQEAGHSRADQSGKTAG